MTIVDVNDLSRHDLQILGANLVATVYRDPDEIEAMNRSLATLGEELDAEIDQAIRSEQVAS